MLEIKGRNNRITKANRKQIYQHLAVREADAELEIVRIWGQMSNLRTQGKLQLLCDSLNLELATRDSTWRVKGVRVQFTRQGSYTCSELHDPYLNWSKSFQNTGMIELTFGLTGVDDL